jgi:hypothetical protein
MANSIEIANLALSNIRARTIQNFTEDSLEAQVIKARYDIARKFVLRAFPWGFANRTIALGEIETDANLPYNSVYNYPNDCIKARHIVPHFILGNDRTTYLRFGSQIPMRLMREIDQLKIPFEVINVDDQRVLVTDQPDAYLQYTLDVIDTNLFPEDYIEMLAWWLSAQIAVPVVGAEKGREMRRDALQMYQTLKVEAQVANANERHNQIAQESDYTYLREEM